MTATELLIIIACAAGGYFLVSFVFLRDEKPSDPAVESTLPWYRTLGVSQAATAEEIKAAYNTLMAQTKDAARMGLDAQSIKILETKVQAITAAYERAQQLRNERF